MGYGRASLDMRLAHLLKDKSVTGACLAHVREDSVEVAAAGVRNHDTAEPVDASTVFGAASLTKPIVSYALLQLVDAGVLDLDEPLSRAAQPIVPDDAASARITMRHVLTHTCGLQNLRDKNPLRLHFPPGAWFSYSSLGFTFLQSAVEAKTGETLEAILRRLVFEPLGMRSSSLEWQDRFLANAANPHEAAQRLDLHRPPAASASYSLQTTAGDYGAFVAAVLRGDGLSASTWQQWLTASVMVPKGEIVYLDGAPAATEPDIGWGLGWGVEPSRGTFFQWGKMQGVRAFVMGSTEQRAGVVLLTNSNTGLRLMEDAARAALPGEHPAIRWLAQGVSE
ncbi:serine hydrolase domain-containing protein [Cupriavidus basilensis]